ncbi:MAG: hypothetical protein ACE5I3_15410 [Phycisphaerae bacterium]
MSTTPGMIDVGRLADLVDAGAIETVLVAFPDLYGRLMGKRFDARFFLETVAQNGAHACNYLLTVDMEMNPIPGYRFANWVSGYGDVHLVPDSATLRVASWLDRTAMVICDVQDEASSATVAEAPQVPKTLRGAVGLLRESAFVTKVLGEQVVEHYAHFFQTEQEAYDRAVTDWERRRYFERI